MQKSTKLCIYSIINLINITIFTALLCKKTNFKLPFDISFHCFVVNCFYFLSVMILEIREDYWHISSEKFLPFLRNELFKFSFAFNCFSVFIYYAFVLLGPIFKTFPKTKIEIFFAIFLNGGQLIFILTEFFISDHVHNPRYVIDSFILLAYFKIYLILCVFGGKKYDIYAFEFMKIADVYQDFVCFLVCKIILINYYGVYQSMLIKKNDYISKQEENNKKKLDDKKEYEMQATNLDRSYDKNDKRYESLNDKILNISQGRENKDDIIKENGTIKIYNDA